MSTTIEVEARYAGEFLVQRAGMGAAKWQTVCHNSSKAYAEDILAKQLKVSCVGKFRLVDPNGSVLQEQQAKMLFGVN